jgi:23S rRNA pseudouridine2605 synthase
VRVDGQMRRNPEAPVGFGSRIEVDDRPVQSAAKIYLMLNKPRGVVTTASDEKGRATVYDVVGKSERWVAPVGRLDKASEGLVLLTNDSRWAAKVLEPETHLDKIYHVQLDTIADEQLLEQLLNGVRTKDGAVLRVKRADIVRRGQHRTWLEIALDEGKNRHIRRIFEHLDIEVLRLVRVAIGPLFLGDLRKGSSRELTSTEKRALDEAIARNRVTIRR